MADTPDLWWRKRVVQAALAVIGPDGIPEWYWSNCNHGGQRYPAPWAAETYRKQYGCDATIWRVYGSPGFSYVEKPDLSYDEEAIKRIHTKGWPGCGYTVGYFLSFVWGNPDPALGGKATKNYPLKNGSKRFNGSSGYGWDIGRDKANYQRYTPSCIASGAVQPYPGDLIMYKAGQGLTAQARAARIQKIRSGQCGTAGVAPPKDGHIEMLTGEMRTVKGKIQVRTVGGNTSNGGQYKGSLNAGDGMWDKWMPIDKDSVLGFNRWIGPDPGYTEAHPLWNTLTIPPHSGPNGWTLNENAGLQKKK